jgi:small GTP-binding protein
MTEETPKTRSGFVALIGAPNAGKSTLVNQLVGAKVSIVTHKVQTTRAIVRGIATHENAQIVFVDTPGIFKPRRRLDTAMVTTAWGGAKDADIVLVLIDAERGIKGDADALLDKVKTAPQPKVLILNKVDRVKPETLLTLTKEANERAEFQRTFMVSALTGSGCKDLLDYLAETLPEAPGTIRRTRSPTCRCASLQPRSPARSSISGCTRSFHTRPMSRRRNGKRRRTVRCASNATARRRSCSATRARPSAPSARLRARRSAKSWSSRSTSSCS